MKLKLLIVEDDIMLGELISHYFTKKEWETTIATDGDMALEQFETDSYHLVLLDVMLPKQNGFTVCRKILPLLNRKYCLFESYLQERFIRSYPWFRDDL